MTIIKKCLTCFKDIELKKRFCNKKCYFKLHTQWVRKFGIRGRTKQSDKKISIFKKRWWKNEDNKKDTIIKIKDGMATPEVKKKLSILNRRPRRPMSNAHKKKISIKLRGKLPLNMKYSNNSYGHFNNGEYDINGKVIYFRSKWEANYALYLDFLKKNKEIKDWNYEVKFYEFPGIKFGTTRYLPDFEIITKDDKIEIHEVKGYETNKDRTKFKRMAKFYPTLKMQIIRGDWFKAIKVKGHDKLLNFY